ncbi:PEP-CTERM sorting domain-containing protein [Tautonia marina]|uniref:PEP-CTERM sorting domain-containing protein n=1 Tax=Tautonia marina TaxID=2653855 RepID=UPI00137596AF|nr:PEP-CTERM sorting domain-containing protein [Tautonia marina]
MAVIVAIGSSVEVHAGIVLHVSGYTDQAVTTISGTNSFGSITDDGAGNIYFTGASTRNVYRHNAGGTASLESLNSIPLGIELVGNDLYVGTNIGEIYRLDTTNPGAGATLVENIGGELMGMAVAPSTFGAYAGQLIISSRDKVVAFDTVTSTSSTVYSGSGLYPALAFGGKGLFVADYSDRQLFNLTSTGFYRPFAPMSGSPGGIAINPNSGEVFIANESAGAIDRYSRQGRYLGRFASNVSWDGGYYPSFFSFTRDGSALLYGERRIGDPNVGIRQITGFEVAAVPEPSTFASGLLGVALIGAGWLRRRRRAA